jgi:WD40 repeat protein
LIGCLFLLLIGPAPAGAQGGAASGARLWWARYGSANTDDEATAMGVNPDGTTVFVTGFTGTNPPRYATIGYDAATGARRWVARSDRTGGRLAVSPDGTTVFVTGGSTGTGSLLDYVTVAYDAVTGGQRWVADYDGPFMKDDFATALAVSPDGATVFVTGDSYGRGTGTDYATVAYDTNTGDQRWVARYDAPGHGNEIASALVVSPDGGTAFVTGQSAVFGGFADYATVAYDATNGVQRWVARYDGPSNKEDAANAMGTSPDGTLVFVTGRSQGVGTGMDDYATLAYDTSTGAQQWVARYDGYRNGDDIGRALGVSPDGATVFVTGVTGGIDHGGDYGTVAYDASTGATRWLARYEGPGHSIDDATALAVSPGGEDVVVTGSSVGSNGASADYATVIYDAATGARRGVARVGPGSASALGESPDGNAVFVTGAIARSNDDYGTVGYSLAP